MGNDAGLRALGRAVSDLVDPLADQRLTGSSERYRLDPWAHPEDGHVRILDLENNETIPFVPYQHQIEMAEAWVDLDHLRKTAQAGDAEIRFRNVHEEKTRQMGATWGLAWVLLWVLIYHEAQGFVLNVNADEVDDGGQASTVDSIFGRIRFMAEHGVSGDPDGEETFWPEYLRPGRFLTFRGRPSIIRNRLRSTSYIRGAVQSPDPGRGRHYTHALLDEAARLAWGESVHAAITRAVPQGRFYNSTPFGKGNVYYRLRETRPAGYTFLRHHWTQHPVYSRGMHVAAAEPTACPQCHGNMIGLRWSANSPVAHRYPGRPTSPWYEQAIVELTDEQVAAELEIDYEGSLTARVFSEFSEEVHSAAEIPYEPAVPVELGIDYGWGASATWVNIYQRLPGELRQVGEVVMMQSTPEQVAAALVEELAEIGYPLVELEPTFTRDVRVIGDPSGDARLATGGTLADEYRKLGWNPQPAENGIAVTINAVKRVLLGRPVRFRISRARCPQTIKAFQENRWPTDRTGRIKDTANEPVNDVHNDAMRATAYYMVETYPPPTVEEALSHATSGDAGSVLRGGRADRTGRIDPGISPGMRL